MEMVGRSATLLADQVRQGRITAVEVVRAHLEQLAAVEHRLGAFVATRRGGALADAEAVDAREDRGQLPLAGVPVAIKDVVDVAGLATRAGSAATSASAAAEDDPIVARFRAAGAVVIGKTRCPELCLWGASDDAEGTAVSPWDPTRSAGGSSGGSGAAVTAGVVPIALASDGLGSIRIPAAACGAVGFKPGTDRAAVALPDGRPHWMGMSVFGPIATTVADTALAMDVIAGTHDLREVAVPEGPLRVAVSVRPPVPGRVSPVWREAAVEAGRLLHHVGHDVRRADPPVSRAAVQAALARWTQGAAEEADALGLDPDRLQSRTRAHLAVGRRLAGVAPVRDEEALAWRELVMPFLEQHDLLVTPAIAQSPIAAVEWWRRPYAANVAANTAAYPFSAPWNLADVPAMVVPVYRDRGRPLAVQLVAGPGREALLLGVAAQLESLAPWTRHAPGWGVPELADS